MPLNPRRLKPGHILTLVNSTSLGEVLTEAALRKLRQSAGHAIGDGQTIDFFRLMNWLVQRRHASPRPGVLDPHAAAGEVVSGSPADDDSYAAHKDRARTRGARIARAGIANPNSVDI